MKCPKSTYFNAFQSSMPQISLTPKNHTKWPKITICCGRLTEISNIRKIASIAFLMLTVKSKVTFAHQKHFSTETKCLTHLDNDNA